MQPDLLDYALRPSDPKPWKVARRVSRAAFFAAEQRGQIENRREIVGRTLRYFWNCHQRSATSKVVARWIITGRRDWVGRDPLWILYETRRAMSDLRKMGLVDSAEHKIGTEFLWRWREAGTGERRVF